VREVPFVSGGGKVNFSSPSNAISRITVTQHALSLHSIAALLRTLADFSSLFPFSFSPPFPPTPSTLPSFSPAPPTSAAVYFEQGNYPLAIETCEKAVEAGRDLRADFKLLAKYGFLPRLSSPARFLVGEDVGEVETHY
jgi:hypothetical protein